MCSLASLSRGCRPSAGNKHCCLCWCCCCSCSCLATRGGPDKPSDSSPADPLLCEGDEPPALDEIRGWGSSFERLMRSAAGRKVFRDFLRGEYSEENIMFWLACEELKRETDAAAVEEKARFIYEDYISILSPKEVSLDSRVREIVNRNMMEPTPHTFDEAQLQIYTLMHRDSYPRFVNSPLYKALAQMSSSSPTNAPTSTLPANTLPASSAPASSAPANTLPASSAPASTMPVNTSTCSTMTANTMLATDAPTGTMTSSTVPANTPSASTVPANTSSASTVPAGTSPSSTMPVSPALTSTMPVSPAPVITMPVSPALTSTMPVSPAPVITMPVSTGSVPQAT